MPIGVTYGNISCTFVQPPSSKIKQINNLQWIHKEKLGMLRVHLFYFPGGCPEEQLYTIPQVLQLYGHYIDECISQVLTQVQFLKLLWQTVGMRTKTSDFTYRVVGHLQQQCGTFSSLT